MKAEPINSVFEAALPQNPEFRNDPKSVHLYKCRYGSNTDKVLSKQTYITGNVTCMVYVDNETISNFSIMLGPFLGWTSTIKAEDKVSCPMTGCSGSDEAQTSYPLIYSSANTLLITTMIYNYHIQCTRSSIT